jgi:hypothetical protein
MTFFAVTLAALALITAFVIFGRSRRAARDGFIDAYRFPPGIRARVRKRYPHLTDGDLDRVMSGLSAWFHLSNAAGRKTVSMPSQVVDAAWHEFILFTRNYRDFCSKALGRFLHHTPAEAMRTPTEAQEGIRRAWRLSCAREGIAPRTPVRLPLLFALDAELGIADGFRYALNCASALGAQRSADGSATYCGSHIGCGSGGGDGGCSSDSGCSGDGGGGCGGGGD